MVPFRAMTKRAGIGRVREVLGDWTLPPIDLWAVLPAGRRAGAKPRAFVDFVERVLAGSRTGAA
jgi:DNA-binding transcriptional LysR family regulator